MKVGIIYKITHPKWNSEVCYIGHTTDTIEKRLKGHIGDAKRTKQSKKDGDGKLHKMMEASGLKDTLIEEIDSADTLEELLNLERKYIKKYDAVKKGLNKVKGSRYITHREETVSIIIKGQKIKATSKNQLCKKLEIKFTTLNHWLAKGANLQEAVDQALRARKETLSKKGKIIVFRRSYDSYNELAKDKRSNRYGYTGRELSQKHKSDKSLEKILKTPKRELSKKIKINLPNGTIKNYGSIKLALENWENLAKDFCLPTSKKKPAYQTVVSYLNDGQEPEQALGLIDRPWKKELIDMGIYKLINNKGYKLTGKLNGVGTPVVDHEKEEIFSSTKEFAKEYNYEYTTIAEEIKKRLTPEQIRKKRGD